MDVQHSFPKSHNPVKAKLVLAPGIRTRQERPDKHHFVERLRDFQQDTPEWQPVKHDPGLSLLFQRRSGKEFHYKETDFQCNATLFLISINAPCNNIKAKVRPFADDTILYNSIQNAVDSTKLQQNLNVLEAWDNRKQMALTSPNAMSSSSPQNKPAEATSAPGTLAWN